MENNFKVIFLLVVLSIHSCEFSNGTKKRNITKNDIKVTLQNTDSLTEKKENSLVDYFSSGNKRLPDTLCMKYFDLRLGEKFKSCTALEFRKIKNFTAYIVKLKCFAGGVCEFYNLYILNNENKCVSKLVVGKRLYDMTSEIDMIYKFVLDTLIETKTTEREFDDDENLIGEYINYKYYFITRSGQIKGLPISFSRQRKFPQSSQRILTKFDLLKFSMEELDIMRNEIFADHGYRFKKKKWQEYFDMQPWYNPRYEDVTDSLSVIEQINLQLILEASAEKK